MNLQTEMETLIATAEDQGDEATATMLDEIRIGWLRGEVPVANARIAAASARERLGLGA